MRELREQPELQGLLLGDLLGFALLQDVAQRVRERGRRRRRSTAMPRRPTEISTAIALVTTSSPPGEENRRFLLLEPRVPELDSSGTGDQAVSLGEYRRGSQLIRVHAAGRGDGGGDLGALEVGEGADPEPAVALGVAAHALGTLAVVARAVVMLASRCVARDEHAARRRRCCWPRCSAARARRCARRRRRSARPGTSRARTRRRRVRRRDRRPAGLRARRSPSRGSPTRRGSRRSRRGSTRRARRRGTRPCPGACCTRRRRAACS